MSAPLLALDSIRLTPGDRIVVGASAGVDSTVLLRLLHRAGQPVIACHVNYGLRGSSSDGDEAFVRDLAARLGVPCHVRHATLPDTGNRQAAARDARYAFFREVAEAEGAAAIAVGHTQDDQAETVILNLHRGAGLRGHAGMPIERPVARGSAIRLVRPLLHTSRAEVEALARAEGWAWREDASNASPHYRRNGVRRETLPALAEAFGEDVRPRLAAAADEARTVLEGPEGPPARLAQLTRGARRLDLAGLQSLPESEVLGVLLEAIRAWAPCVPRSTATSRDLAGLLDAQPGRRVVWPGVTIWRERDALVFVVGDDSGGSSAAWPVAVGGHVVTPAGVLTLTALPEVPEQWSPHADEEVVDESALQEPLVLRPWRTGDRFQPLGLRGTKKVSDLLTERRVQPSQRKRQLVLCADGAIVWVVGHRLAEGARVHAGTRRAVRLTWADNR